MEHASCPGLADLCGNNMACSNLMDGQNLHVSNLHREGELTSMMM